MWEDLAREVEAAINTSRVLKMEGANGEQPTGPLGVPSTSPCVLATYRLRYTHTL